MTQLPPFGSPHGKSASPTQPISLIPPEIAREIPKLNATQEQPDPVAHVKFFTRWTDWAWFIIEFDGSDQCFALVHGFEVELGHVSLQEIQSVRGPGGLLVERDPYFLPSVISRLRRREPRIICPWRERER
jgi:hypothetical protein